MASIVKTNKGYSVRFYFDKVRYSKTCKTKRECKDWVIKKTEELIHNSLKAPINKSIVSITFKDLLVKYFYLYLLDNPKKKTDRLRVGKLIREYPELTNKKVVDLTKADMRAWVEKCSRDVSGSTVQKYSSLINNVFKAAINEWDFNFINPLIGIRKPKANLPRERYIEDWEINSLLAQLGYDQSKALESIKIRIGAAFLFSLETAMRAGEICNLEWDDISPSGLVLKVKTAKTRSGIREVPLSSKARKIIEQCKLENDTPKVFRLTTAQLDANFRKYRKEAKLKGFTFHDSRATAITKLAKKLDILDLAKMVGHKDPKMLMVYYRQGAEALVDRLG